MIKMAIMTHLFKLFRKQKRNIKFFKNPIRIWIMNYFMWLVVVALKLYQAKPVNKKIVNCLQNMVNSIFNNLALICKYILIWRVSCNPTRHLSLLKSLDWEIICKINFLYYNYLCSGDPITKHSNSGNIWLPNFWKFVIQTMTWIFQLPFAL